VNDLLSAHCLWLDLSVVQLACSGSEGMQQRVRFWTRDDMLERVSTDRESATPCLFTKVDL